MRISMGRKRLKAGESPTCIRIGRIFLQMDSWPGHTWHVSAEFRERAVRAVFKGDVNPRNMERGFGHCT